MKQSEKCYVAGCDEAEVKQCDGCEAWYCLEHGQRGGDRQVQDVGAVAYPALCDVCVEEARRG